MKAMLAMVLVKTTARPGASGNERGLVGPVHAQEEPARTDREEEQHAAGGDHGPFFRPCQPEERQIEGEEEATRESRGSIRTAEARWTEGVFVVKIDRTF